MKILFVPSDNNATSGAFLSMVKLCSLLQNQYRHNILVLLHCNGNGEKLLEDNNIEYVKIRSFNWFVPYKPKQIIRKIKLALCYIWMPLSQVYNIIAIRKIRRLIKKEKIQIVHINTSCSYVGAQAALLENIPFVWHIREFLEEDQERCIWNNKKGYSLIGEANRVVAISDSIYQKYKKLLPEADIVTIYNGIDSDDFYIDHKDLFSGNGINLAIVGSINRSKGQDQAIKACEILIEEGIDNINLRIAGKESEYVNFLRNYVGSKNLDKWIQFIGPQSDIKQLYRDTDIVLMCSQSEAFGRVTVEAMMSGCLVIGANSGGTMELVSDNETGLLYTSGDYSDLAAKITSDCLEQLLAADDFIDDDNTSFYASAVFGSAGEFMNVPNIDTSESANGYPHFYKYLGEGIINIADATFVSLLIRKDAVLRCGLPCKDYFIWGDDGEYTLRLTHFYGPAYMVGKSIAIHKRMGAKKLDLSNFQDENRIKMYHYYVRNNIVNQLYYKKDRNRAITIIKKLAQAVCSVKYLGQKNGAIKARTVWKGTIEGFSQFNTFKTYIDAQISKK